MFYEKVGENCETTGTNDFELTGESPGSFQPWSTGPADGEDGFYLATDDAGETWEVGYGTYSAGSPAGLTRNPLASSSGGSKIDWTGTYVVYSIPTAAALKHLLAPLVNGVANVPAWLPSGARWADYSLGYVSGDPSTATAWVDREYVTGTRTAAASHVEKGRDYLNLSGGVTHMHAASQRSLFVDHGAADYTFDANDVGKVHGFNVAGGAHIITAPAASVAGIGHSAYIFVYPYGHKLNGVTFTPGGSDATDLASAPPNRVTKFVWDGARSKWVGDYVAPAPVLRSYLAGLGMSNNASPNTKVDVAAGQCADSTNVMMLTVSAGTIDCGGTGANGLDTGSLANNTTYHAYAIGKATDGTTALLASTSASSPTMPSGYTLKRRIGSFRTDGSAHIIAFVQDGDLFQLKATVLDVDATDPGSSAVTRTLASLPTGVNVIAILNVENIQGSTAFQTYLSDLAVNDEAPSQTAAPLGGIFPSSGASAANVGPVQVRTNTSAQIRSRCTATGGADILRIATLGWIDRRGRDA